MSTVKKTTPKAAAESEYRASAVNLRSADWELLSWVAKSRAKKKAKAGEKAGRASVSAVLQSLIDLRRKSLESEAGTVENPYE